MYDWNIFLSRFVYYVGLPACILHEYNELRYWLQPILPFPMYKR